jgi:predicted TIM-barrel fold metal-dependent hydrolase
MIIDTDVHHHYGWSDLKPYLPDGTRAPVYGGRAGPKVTGLFREDTFPAGGGIPSSDPELVAEQHLDRYGIDYALLSCGSTLGLVDLPDADAAAVIARATNDWTINEWFPFDERFLGAVVISPNDPDQAADEIRRAGTHPRMVAVVSTSPPTLLGHSFMNPIYEACASLGLPYQLHPGGQNIGMAKGGGAATTLCEYRATMPFVGIRHLISLVTEGVFATYPTFRFVLNEWGVAWLPFVLWRLDMEFRQHREELPWLTQLPSEYIARHVRFTTQPVEEPRQRGDFAQVMSVVGAEELLMYASDYPHHDFDSPEIIREVIPEAWRDRIFYDNAREWYCLDERLGKVEPLLARAQ